MYPGQKRGRNNGPSGLPPRRPEETKQRTFINSTTLPNSINILQRQLIRFENKLNDTKQLYENINRIFQEPKPILQKNQHVIHFHRVEKPKIETFFQSMILRLEHSKSILRQTINQRMSAPLVSSNRFLKKTIESLNQSELDKIFEYLENLQIRIVEPYERYKIEQRRRIERTFRTPIEERRRERERKEKRYLINKIGYPRSLVEHGVVELSPSVRNNELLPSHLKERPYKPNLVSQPSNEYPPHFAVKELFPNESLYLSSNSENENNEEHVALLPVAAPVVPVPPVSPVGAEEEVNVPTQRDSQGGGKRKKGKKRS